MRKDLALSLSSSATVWVAFLQKTSSPTMICRHSIAHRWTVKQSARMMSRRRPRVAVMATGSELVDVNQRPARDQIRDSNNYTIEAYASQSNAIVERLPLAGDNTEELKRMIREAAETSNVLITSGGVSMGVYDFTKAALKELGAEIFFERVALRPGKPTVFARLGNTLVFGLPGNPVSVAVTFNLFARTALWEMEGSKDVTLP